MGSIAGSNIEWQFLIAVKITFNKAVPCADRIKAVYAAHKFEPAFSNRYICNLITHDDAKRICRFFINNQFQPVDHGWRHIKPARLKNNRCDRQPRCSGFLPRIRNAKHFTYSAAKRFFDAYGIIRALSSSSEHRPHDRQPVLSAIWRQSCHHCR